MATINYKFADGHTEEIDVTEEFAHGYAKLQKKEERYKEREKKRRRKTVSLDLLCREGGIWPIRTRQIRF